MSLVADGDSDKVEHLTDDNCICITSKGRPIKPKTLGQKKYTDAIKQKYDNDCRRSCGNGKDLPCRCNGC